jgi:hypothetical protein
MVDTSQQITVGTAEAASLFPNHPYFGAVLGEPRFGRTEILDEWKIKAYFGKSKASLSQVMHT